MGHFQETQCIAMSLFITDGFIRLQLLAMLLRLIYMQLIFRFSYDCVDDAPRLGVWKAVLEQG